MNTHTRAGRPTGNHDARRQELAEATWRVIHEVGIDKASMRSIAREAGCTTGLLAHYFSNKDEILTFAVASVFQHLRREVESFQTTGDYLAALRRLALRGLPFDKQTRLEWSVWLSFLARAQHNDAFAEEIRAHHGKFRSQLEELIWRGQAAGAIRVDVDATVLTDQFNAQLDGLALMAPFEKKRFPRQYLTELIELAIDNLRPRESQEDRHE